MLERSSTNSNFASMLLTIFMTVVITGTLVYLVTPTYEKDNTQLKLQVEDLQKQIDATKAQQNLTAATAILDANGQPIAPALNPDGTPIVAAAGTTTDTATQTQVATGATTTDSTAVESHFTCGNLTSFSNMAWYSKMSDAAKAGQIDLTKITKACYSADGKMIVMNKFGTYCTLGSIFQYNIETNTLKKASVLEKGNTCIAWPTIFQGREGFVINMDGGSGTDTNKCKVADSFKYNYTTNTLELTARNSTCPGQAATTTNY